MSGNPRSCGNASDARSTYATAYDAFWKAANSPSSKAKYEVALRGNPRGVLSIHVLLQALSGASRRQDFESAPHFFCLFGSALSAITKRLKMRR